MKMDWNKLQPVGHWPGLVNWLNRTGNLLE